MLGLIIAIVAGYLVPRLEAPVAKPINAALQDYIKIEEAEIRLVAFIAALIGASILSALFDTGSSFGLCIGMIIGYFGTRILRAFQNRDH